MAPKKETRFLSSRQFFNARSLDPWIRESITHQTTSHQNSDRCGAQPLASDPINL